MALTLRSDISADDTSIDVDGTDAITTDYLTIGDEIMAVQSIGPGVVHYPGALGYQVVGVRRGQLGSTRAAHSGGASISQTLALGSPRVLTLSGQIAWDDTGNVNGNDDTFAEGATIPVIDLPAGALLLEAWVEVTQPFNGGTTYIQVLVANGSLSPLHVSVHSAWYVTAVQGHEDYTWASQNPDDPGDRRLFRMTGDARLCVSTDGGSPTSGSANVYAVVAMPA